VKLLKGALVEPDERIEPLRDSCRVDEQDVERVALANVRSLVGHDLIEDLFVAGGRPMDERRAEEGERRAVFFDVDHPDAVAVDDGVPSRDEQQVRQVPPSLRRRAPRPRRARGGPLPVPSAGGRHGRGVEVPRAPAGMTTAGTATGGRVPGARQRVMPAGRAGPSEMGVVLQASRYTRRTRRGRAGFRQYQEAGHAFRPSSRSPPSDARISSRSASVLDGLRRRTTRVPGRFAQRWTGLRNHSKTHRRHLEDCALVEALKVVPCGYADGETVAGRLGPEFVEDVLPAPGRAPEDLQDLLALVTPSCPDQLTLVCQLKIVHMDPPKLHGSQA
jgi:hypothetical protein